MNCKYCNNEYEEKSNKLFCSRACKAKWRYHNDEEYRKRKIAKSYKNVYKMRELKCV